MVRGFMISFIVIMVSIKIGLCYSNCLIDKIDNDRYDIKVNEIITDNQKKRSYKRPLFFIWRPPTRIELATYCLGGNCSILLSYEDTNKLYHITTKNRIKKNLKIGTKIKKYVITDFFS